MARGLMGARIEIRSSQAQVALWPLAGIVPGPSRLQKAAGVPLAGWDFCQCYVKPFHGSGQLRLQLKSLTENS